MTLKIPSTPTIARQRLEELLPEGIARGEILKARLETLILEITVIQWQ